MVAPMGQRLDDQGPKRRILLRVALGLAAVAGVLAPATAAATRHLDAAGPTPPPAGLQGSVAHGEATGTVLSHGQPSGGWLGAIAP